MRPPNETANIDESGGYGRRSVYNFMHATASLIESTSVGQAPLYEPALCWVGLLIDISDEDAEVAMPYNRVKYFREGLHVDMEIKTNLRNLNTNVTAQIKSIEADHDYDSIYITVQFTNMESNKSAQRVIARICELGKKLEGLTAREVEQLLSREDRL